MESPRQLAEKYPVRLSKTRCEARLGKRLMKGETMAERLTCGFSMNAVSLANRQRQILYVFAATRVLSWRHADRFFKVTMQMALVGKACF